MIKAVMFDFWGTLITGIVTEKTLERADKIAYRYLKKQGYDLSYKDYQKRRDEAFERYQEHAAKGIHLRPEEGLKRFMFYGLDAKIRDVRKIIYLNERYDCNIKFRKGCKDVLRELKKRNYKIALVSNSWLGHGQYWLKKEKLDKYFDAIILSCDAGIAKPDKRIFELAAKKLKVPLSECVFVGDKHDSDIQGAHDAGIKCKIAIEPFKKKHNLAPPTAIVKNLADILLIIDSLS
jgi:HAD superfamily hydrolase (TIGR01509 family)